MDLDVYEFGKGEHPDRAFGVIDPECFDDGPKYGAGLLIGRIIEPEKHTYGETTINCDECEPIFAMWFFREESIDAAINKLMEIKVEIINQRLRE